MQKLARQPKFPFLLVVTGVNIAQYRKRIESFIKANENHITIAKQYNKPFQNICKVRLTTRNRFVL